MPITKNNKITNHMRVSLIAFLLVANTFASGNKLGYLRNSYVAESYNLEKQQPETYNAQGHRKLATLNIAGDNRKPASAFPLGKCEGDCDSDSDCASNLMCYQRGSSDKTIPGCSGTPTAAKDYCFNPADDEPPEGAFRMKLYWEEGYHWQGSHKESKWCMECTGGSCQEDDRIEIKGCDEGNTNFRFLESSGRGRQIQVEGTNLCFEMHHRGRTLELKQCDAGQELQRFEAGEGDLDDYRFDIRPVMSNMQGCLTQQHHPKSGEEVRATDCLIAHKDDTGYWNKLSPS